MNTEPRAFAELGYIVFRTLLDEGEVRQLRLQLQGRADEMKQYQGLAAELLSYSDLRWLVTDPRIIGAVKSIGVEPTVYFGDSTASAHIQRGFHRDNVDRDDECGPDWQSQYNVVRLAIYLQDHERFGNGLAVKPGSHLSGAQATSEAYVASRLGDIVVWNLRLLHSGGAGAHLPAPQDRLAIFCTYGVPGAHLERYLAYLATRRFHHERFQRSMYEARDLPGVSIWRRELPKGSGRQVKHSPLPY